MTSERDGTGLGLCIGRQIIASRGGTIHLEENGGGATVRIELRHQAESAAHETSGTTPARATKPRQILIVDDEPNKG